MAVRIKRRTKTRGEMDMSSISDIVFLLLIYFMVVAVFQQDIGMPFVLPAATQDEDTTVQIKQSNVADILIHPSGMVTLDDVPIHVNALKRELENRLLSNPKLVVILTNHPQSKYGVFAAVLDEVRLAKCRKMAIKMQEL